VLYVDICSLVALFLLTIIGFDFCSEDTVVLISNTFKYK